MVHQVRMLAFFCNISRLSDSSEKWLAEKSLDSHCWFVGVKKLCIKYGLPDSLEVLEKPRSKLSWKSTGINNYLGNHMGLKL